MQRRINHARNLVDKVESKCMLTSSNLRITVAIAQVMCSHMQARGMHACMHANPGIDERGVQYVYVWGHAVENV